MEVKIKKIHPEARMPTQGTSGAACFYLLHVPVKGKIAPTLFPTEYFVKQKEDEG